MPLSNDSKLTLRKSIREINSRISAVNALLDDARDKRDAVISQFQKIQKEKQDLLAKKQSIQGDINNN